MSKDRKFKILFAIFLAITGIFALIQMPFLGLFAIGGVITQGILGGFSGKVGPVVGGKWKSIDYMRGYVVPENPNTTNQQTVRAKFGALVELARGLLATILQPFWDPFYTNKSGFNAWISENYSLVDGSNQLTVNSVMSKGTLEGSTITSAVKSGSTLSIEFPTSANGNGLDSDFVIGIVVDKVNKLFYFNVGQENRSAGQVDITVPAGLTVGNAYAYLAFYRGTGSEMIVSDSIGATVS